jgi:lipoyl(octanoyl) transferase
VTDNLSFKSLGLCDYEDSFLMMKSQIKEEDFKNEIWFLEHPPVFTLGTAADKKHILDSKDIPIVQSDRGGEVTYHGPGQLVIYFLLDVKKRKLGPRKLVESLEQFLITLLKKYSIDGSLICGSPGVYVDQAKIASIGLRIKKGRSYHGISLNTDMDLAPFYGINPCGYKGLQVTQLRDLNKEASFTSVEEQAIALAKKVFK